MSIKIFRKLSKRPNKDSAYTHGAGDMLPCDVRFVRTKDCFISQAALTGESQPVEKFVVPPALRNPENGPECKALTDLPTVGFMGTDLLSGSADAVAVLSGKDSYLASIAESLSGARAKTAFESGVNSVSRLLIRMMLLIVPIIFAINGFKSQDWLSALIFSVSIAVGLTPGNAPCHHDWYPGPRSPRNVQAKGYCS